MNWEFVGFTKDLKDELPCRFVVGDGLPICIIKTGRNVYALHDKCSHGDFPLSDGFVENGEIECPLHGGRFCLKKGNAVFPPATESVQVYDVKVEEGKIFVRLNTC